MHCFIDGNIIISSALHSVPVCQALCLKLLTEITRGRGKVWSPRGPAMSSTGGAEAKGSGLVGDCSFQTIV